MTARQRRNIRKIKEIAESVRSSFEKIAGKGHWSRDLEGLCGDSAAQIFLECRREDIYVQIAQGSGHVFCMYAGHIIDVTATQFSSSRKKYPKVFIAPMPEAPCNWHRIYKTFRSVKAMDEAHWDIKGRNFKKYRKMIMRRRNRA
jgi:hypothetical protein